MPTPTNNTNSWQNNSNTRNRSLPQGDNNNLQKYSRFYHNSKPEDFSMTEISSSNSMSQAQSQYGLSGNSSINNNTNNNSSTSQSQPVDPNPIDYDSIQNLVNGNNDIETKHQTNYHQNIVGVNDEYSDSDFYDGDGSLVFDLPDYGYDKYINDISNWQKQKTTFGSEPGWFFFKVFFNFHTNYGLLGGLTTITENGQQNKSINTAYGYLKTIRNIHRYENISERILSLAKFVGTLKDISLRTPWIFKSISGLNTINSRNVDSFDKEKTIIIGCSQESVDNRIGTMLDLYKYACFDSINCKEIIPANLRKFEMSIIVYHMPLSSYHKKALTSNENSVKTNFFSDIFRTGVTYNYDGILPSKTMSETDRFDNMMSFKLFTFQNCEIDCENINEYYVDGVTNETAFQLGNNQIKIKYDRVYEHRMNEWLQMFFGSDGFYYNNVIPQALTNENANNEYYINNKLDGDKNYYLQRLNALKGVWEGKTTIMDYTKILIGAYYHPRHISAFPQIDSIITTGLGNQSGIAKWDNALGLPFFSNLGKFYNMVSGMKKNYNDYLNSRDPYSSQSPTITPLRKGNSNIYGGKRNLPNLYPIPTIDDTLDQANLYRNKKIPTINSLRENKDIFYQLEGI